MITLEKYKGKNSRHNCPKCGGRKTFALYLIDGEPIADNVGICDRRNQCNYHYPPKQYFIDNPTIESKPQPKRQFRAKVYSQPKTTVSTIADQYLLDSVSAYLENDFTRGLLALFPEHPETVRDILQMYFVGSFDGLTAFWQVDKFGKIRTAKLMRYNSETLKRQAVYQWTDKETNELETVKTYWIHKALEKKGLIKDFQLETVFFGEHLLTKFPNKKIAVCEAEKTAIICSILLRDLMPDYIWLSAGSLGMLQVERLSRLGNREVLLFPDTNAFIVWQRVADEANKAGLNVFVSDLLETSLTDQQKQEGLDLADFLINEQREKSKNPQSTLLENQVVTVSTWSEDNNERVTVTQTVENDKLSVAEIRTQNLRSDSGQDVGEVLKQLFAKGCFFELTGTGETAYYPAYLLTEAENHWLIRNYQETMAHLFQIWLMQNVFNNSRALLQEFKTEVVERIGIMEDSDEPAAYLNAVLCVSRKWWFDYQNEVIQWH